ncbi:DNA-directed RNA polymerase III subunit RPC8-like [Xenia sp. Carnegie-2017]|uniref:DNA-directed RNA polymerase III subunit RPC8-like n=1 Tax=Xenia sp. Carnegie-2017 TaxID=2897299 RepID=UPI001F04E506|nr:DNA-directed RNA polymerase III subunit RPC8-like [Xenia sp. Carnegie-2017]
MFLLAEMKDTVRMPPTKFGLNLIEAVTNELNKKLANKVVYNVGLCIALHDIIDIGDSFVLPGDGASCTPVKFRYVVFRPFIDEILIGRIKACSHEGVTVSMEFFDDIIIPFEYLQQPSKFDAEEQLWVWEYETEEGTHDLFMDINEEIRFRVIDECFTDLTPTGPEMIIQEQAGNQEEKCPYNITATITEPGLGLLSWWANS